MQTDRGHFNLLDDDPTTYSRARYRSNSVQFGLRYSFGGEEAPPPPPPPEPVAVVPVVQAPPPPPPPPPPCVVPTDGTAPNFDGCKLGDTLVLRGVNFEFDKSRLTVNAKTLLDQVADALQKRADIKIELDGYTDSKGSDAYNQNLSQHRAVSVKDYLVGRGIADDRITTAGFGEASPVADNNTDEGRELNRRVELKVTDATDPVSVAPVDSGTVDAGSAPADSSAAPDLAPVDDTTAPATDAAPADSGAPADMTDVPADTSAPAADTTEAPATDVAPDNGGQ
ncbi:OmpA family protein [Solimonas terrae]|uniref:OmpA family protein n=1 Tax=Solimonas terrae TaxID=1396819 RepID=A0A6M2BUS0_9GAMM|nr:OmpA family protein [Solimonas terrae]